MTNTNNNFGILVCCALQKTSIYHLLSITVTSEKCLPYQKMNRMFCMKHDLFWEITYIAGTGQKHAYEKYKQIKGMKYFQ
jgi:hypothetical protein